MPKRVVYAEGEKRDQQNDHHHARPGAISSPLAQVLQVSEAVAVLRGQLETAADRVQRAIEVAEQRAYHVVLGATVRVHVVVQANEFPRRKVES